MGPEKHYAAASLGFPSAVELRAKFEESINSTVREHFGSIVGPNKAGLQFQRNPVVWYPPVMTNIAMV